MVMRRGYYVKDGKLKHVDFEIAWDLGFDKEAKIGYIKRAYIELFKKGFKYPLDVTSANKMKQRGYLLSPLYLKLDGQKVEDMFQDAVGKMNPTSLLLYSNWLLGKAIGARERDLVLAHDVYIDIFSTPQRSETSQSKAYGVWRLLYELGMLDIYDNPEEFYSWYIQNIGGIQ